MNIPTDPSKTNFYVVKQIYGKKLFLCISKHANKIVDLPLVA